MFTYPVGFMGGQGEAAPFVPTDIPGCVLWLDAADRGSVANRWDDKSGWGRHFTASAAGEFPAFAGGIATFDGSNDHLDGPNFSGVLSAGELLVRMKRDNDPALNVATSGFIIGVNNFTGGSGHYPYTNGSCYLGFGRTSRFDSIGNPETSLATWHTLGIISRTGEWTLYVNDTQQVTTASTTPSFGGAASILGTSLPSDTTRFDGQAKSIVLFDHKLSAAERTSMRDYMAAL